MAKATACTILSEIDQIHGEADRGMFRRFAKSSQNKNRLAAMISVAQSEKAVVVTPGQFDRDPYLLNCLNGTLELKTGRLGNHRKTDLLTKLAPVNFNPRAMCQNFDAFLNRIMDNDAELIGYLQRCLGYALSGDVREKVLFVLVGKGDNGKTTLVEVVRHVLGDYAGQIPIESLMVKHGSDGIPNEIAKLQGRRFVSSSEVEQGKRLAEAKVKNLTGMGTLQARFLYQEYFEFEPCFKIFMDTNHKPEIRGTDQAIWNRMRVIPFKVSIPRHERDPELREKLKAEAPGILAWLVRGCLDWQAHGLGSCPAVDAASTGYREEMDTVAEFIQAECERQEGLKITAAAFYQGYSNWCHRNGEEPLSPRAVGMQLKDLGLQPCKVKNDRAWAGIALTAHQPAKAA